MLLVLFLPIYNLTLQTRINIKIQNRIVLTFIAYEQNRKQLLNLNHQRQQKKFVAFMYDLTCRNKAFYWYHVKRERISVIYSFVLIIFTWKISEILYILVKPFKLALRCLVIFTQTHIYVRRVANIWGVNYSAGLPIEAGFSVLLYFRAG